MNLSRDDIGPSDSAPDRELTSEEKRAQRKLNDYLDALEWWEKAQHEYRTGKAGMRDLTHAKKVLVEAQRHVFNPFTGERW